MRQNAHFQWDKAKKKARARGMRKQEKKKVRVTLIKNLGSNNMTAFHVTVQE